MSRQYKLVEDGHLLLNKSTSLDGSLKFDNKLKEILMSEFYLHSYFIYFL